ncbi:MAG: hypothetical protein FVQ81_13440 [Candidatus Glassbacteria bacterium]|nr:hypothetical protein [Candidatus Glassbacteria bacterium]
MKFAAWIMAVLVSALAFTGVALAAESDYTWTISGSLDGEADTNRIFVAVTSDSLLGAATLEIHYDTTKLEFVPYDDAADYLTGRVAVFTNPPTIYPYPDYQRILLFDFSLDIPAGSGDVLKFLFKVKDGVTGGTLTTIYLTTRRSVDTLATQQFEVEGSIWDTPGDPAQSSWNMKGTAVADSNAAEVYVVMGNSLWIAEMVLDLSFDPQVLDLTEASTDITLKGRASDLNLSVAYVAASGTAQLTISTTSATPPFPVIDPGSGTILGIKFSVVSPLADGEMTQIDLSLADGTELVTHQLQARAYTGPTADVDGNGSTSIFDVLEFLVMWQNAPPSPFTDVNGDGKSDIFDLLAILAEL